MRNSLFWGSWSILIYSGRVRTREIKTLPSEQHFEYWGLRAKLLVLSSTQKRAPQKVHSWLMRPRISLCTLGFANGARISHNPTGRATWMPSSRTILAQRSMFWAAFAKRLSSRCSMISNVRNCACCSAFARRLASRAANISNSRVLMCCLTSAKHLVARAPSFSNSRILTWSSASAKRLASRASFESFAP